MNTCKVKTNVAARNSCSNERLWPSSVGVARALAPLKRPGLTVLVHSSKDEFCSVSDESCNFPDPEEKYSRYGQHYGRGFKLQDLIWSVPRVRVRTPREAVTYRQQEELLELALLNARLEGEDTWEARKRLEYLKIRRENWQRVYEYVTKQDAAATLSLIEEACAKVEETLSEEAQESQSVSDLNQSLQNLQQDVEQAQEKLNLTQKRVEKNLDRVRQLKAEAASLEKLRMAQMANAVNAATVAVQNAVMDVPVSSNVVPAPQAPQVSKSNRRSLQSSLELEDGLKNFWYPVHFTSKLQRDVMVPFDLFGQPWVLFRDENGDPACVRDACAHRACPLSVGKLVDGQIECAYHGWRFNGDGQCTRMPSTVQCRNIAVSSLPTVERDGFIMVWPGSDAPTEVPDVRPPYGFEVHAEIDMEVPVEHGLLVENLLDLAHAPFTHTSTFAKGWPVPDMVKFNATKLLSGNWDPYPIDMAFLPPCMTISMIGLAQPGKIERGARASACQNHLHQLHVCLPSKKGHTRLLYRMSMDFMGWVKHVPYIDSIWKGVASQVLNEDLVLVKGQQERLEQGADIWANPVSYDKLGVRYRQWRNGLKDSPQVLLAAPIMMSAGQLFDVNDEVFVDQESQ